MFKMLGLAVFLFSSMFLTGCGNLSPRDNMSPQIQEHIDNQNGKIGEIENIQNGFKNEIFKLQQGAEIIDSELDKVQQGMLNIQSNNENSGVQIFSGPGGLALASFGIFASILASMYYRKTAKINEEAADVMAEQIAKSEDAELEEQVLLSALGTKAEEKVYNLITKHQN